MSIFSRPSQYPGPQAPCLSPWQEEVGSGPAPFLEDPLSLAASQRFPASQIFLLSASCLVLNDWGCHPIYSLLISDLWWNLGLNGFYDLTHSSGPTDQAARCTNRVATSIIQL